MMMMISNEMVTRCPGRTWGEVEWKRDLLAAVGDADADAMALLDTVAPEAVLWCLVYTADLTHRTLCELAVRAARLSLVAVGSADPQAVITIETSEAWLRGEVTDARMHEAAHYAFHFGRWHSVMPDDSRPRCYWVISEIAFLAAALCDRDRVYGPARCGGSTGIGLADVAWGALKHAYQTALLHTDPPSPASLRRLCTELVEMIGGTHHD